MYFFGKMYMLENEFEEHEVSIWAEYRACVGALVMINAGRLQKTSELVLVRVRPAWTASNTSFAQCAITVAFVWVESHVVHSRPLASKAKRPTQDRVQCEWTD